MFADFVSSRTVPLIVISCFSIILVQKLLSSSSSRTKADRGKLRLHLPIEAYRRSNNWRIPVSLAFSTISFIGILRCIENLFRIADILKKDLTVNSRQSGTGVYRGSVSADMVSYQSVSINDAPPLISSVVEMNHDRAESFKEEISKIKEISKSKGLQLFITRRNKTDYYYLTPSSLMLENNDDKMLLSDQKLIEGSSNWPIVSLLGGTETLVPIRYKHGDTPKDIRSFFSTVSTVLGPSARIKIEFCEKGLRAGASLFIYGLGKKSIESKWTELNKVEFLTTSIDLMKRFLREKFSKHLVVLLGAAVVCFISTRYFLLNQTRNEFKMTVQRAQRKSYSLYHSLNALKHKDPLSIDKQIHLYSFPYDQKSAQKIFRCECNKYLKNILSFSCGHLACCYHCLTTNKEKACFQCKTKVNDFCVVSLV